MNALAALLLALAADAAAPVPLAGLTLERAAELDGQVVIVTFTAGKPAATWRRGGKTVTVCGPADADEVERTVVLRGDRVKACDAGAKVKVEGVLRVIRHPAVVVGGVKVPAWAEVRVEE